MPESKYVVPAGAHSPVGARPLIVKPLISTSTPPPVPSTVTTSCVPVTGRGSTIVVCAEPAPTSLTDFVTMTCSAKVPAQTWIVSPAAAAFTPAWTVGSGEPGQTFTVAADAASAKAEREERGEPTG